MAKKADEAKNAKLMDDRAKALETTLASLEKQFGKGTVMKLGEQAHMKVDVVPTGCLELDLALGVGGIPKGRIIEIYGPESSGKTRSPCISWPSPKSAAASRPLSTPSTRWIPTTLKSWA